MFAVMQPPCSLAHGGGGGGGHGGGGGGFHSSSSGHFGASHAFAGSHTSMHSSLSHSTFGSGLNRSWGSYRWRNQLPLGYWSSWSNPSLNYSSGWGNWGLPLYAAGPGFTNLNPNVLPSSILDENGNDYTGATYRYDQAHLTDYAWTDSTRISEQSDVHDEPAHFRLGPGTDIIGGGKVVIGVSSAAYLLVMPAATQLISTESGLPIVALRTDPSLLWHLSSEIKRQMLGLESAIQQQVENKQKLGQQADESGDDPKLITLRTSVDLLKAAQANLGDSEPIPPAPAPPPVADADELFAGTWVTQDAKFVVLKRADGTIVYTNGMAWYSDQGKTSISGPSLDAFKRVVVSYISSLVSDAPQAEEYLKQFKHESETQVHSLKGTLKKLQSEVNAAADSQHNEYTDAINRVNAQLNDANQRLNNINQMQEEIPKELATVKGILKNWQ